MRKIFRNKRVKIFYEELQETTLLQVYIKGYQMLSAISENTRPEEYQEDYKDALEVTRKFKTARKWIRKNLKR